METSALDWRRVGEAIAARINDVPLIKAEVIRTSGVSGKTLDGYIDGKPVVRGDKKRDLCEALGWTHDSIDRILQGELPLVVPGWMPPTKNSPGGMPDEDTELIADRLHKLIDELARRARPR